MPISTIYTITNTQGSLTFQMTAGSSNGPNELAQTTDLTYYGYGRTGWGQQVDQNFYSLLENFACEQSAPNTPNSKMELGGTLGINAPITGQLWYNLSNTELYAYNGTTWDHILSEGFADGKYLTIADATTGYVNITGDTMTGLLILSGDPVVALGAATKQYVDNLVTTTGSNYVLKAGDTMTGPLTVTVSGSNSAFIKSEIATNVPYLTLGKHSTATSAVQRFITSGSTSGAPTIDSAIIASGGSIGTNYQGTLTLYGFAMVDRNPTLANQIVNKSYLDTQITNLSNTFNTLYVKKAGDSMTGALTLSGNPTNALHATPKQYVDLFLPKSGGTMTGYLTLNANPVNPLHAATKQYVDSVVGAPSGQFIYWTDVVEINNGTYNGVFADVKSFAIVTPTNVSFVMVDFVFYVQIIHHARVTDWRLLWNGVEVGYGITEGTGDNTISRVVTMPFFTSVTGSTGYTLTLQAYSRGTDGSTRTNYGQLTSTPTNGPAGKSSVRLVYF